MIKYQQQKSCGHTKSEVIITEALVSVSGLKKKKPPTTKNNNNNMLNVNMLQGSASSLPFILR
jgi:hypothetical protein